MSDFFTFAIEEPRAIKTEEKREYVPRAPLGKALKGIPITGKNLNINQNELISYGQNIKVLEGLLRDKSVNPASRDSMSLRVAAKMGMLESVKMLIATGCDPSANHNEAIIWAAENGYDDVVLFLMRQYNTDPSDQNNKALELAKQYDHNKIIEVLTSDSRVSGIGYEKDPC